MKINFKDKKNLIRLKKISYITYDYIIIGSGPESITLLNKLKSYKKRNPKILVIERGDFYKKEYKKINYTKLPIKFNSRVFSVGGTSNEWSNISSYFEKFEMEARWLKKIKNFWPISHTKLIEYYKSLDKNLGFNYQKIKKIKSTIPFEIRNFIANKKPKNFKYFLNSIDVDLIYNCNITSVDEIKNLTFVNTEKKNFFFKGLKTIICCGGIESVNLVLNSLSQKKILKMKNKKSVGQFFSDHPKLNLGYLMFPKIKLIKKFQLRVKNKYIEYFGLSIKNKIQKDMKLLNTYVRFEKSSNRVSKALKLIKIPLLQRLIKNKFKSFYKIRMFCEMKPTNDNMIIQKNKKLYVNYKFNNIEYSTIKFLTKRILDYFSYYPEKEVEILYSKKFIDRNIEDASHHMGGLIYSPDKKIACVDKNLRINGLKNIFVCSSAIFPTFGSVNPTMTICAFAYRLGIYLSGGTDNHYKK